MFFAQHTPFQPDMLYLLICWMQSSSEGQENHRESTLLQSSLMGGRMFVGKEKITTSSPPLNQYSTIAKTKGTTDTPVSIADELKAVINDLGPQKVFALVTDNAAKMKAAWTKVEESYPHITPIGGAAHASWHMGHHGTENNGYTLQDSQENGYVCEGPSSYSSPE